MEVRVKVNFKNISLYHSLCCVNSKTIFYQLSCLVLAYAVRAPKKEIFMVGIGLELKKNHKSVCLRKSDNLSLQFSFMWKL